MQLLIQLANGDHDALNVLAVVEVLLGLFVAFFQLNLHGDHLQNVGISGTCSARVNATVNAYLHVGVGQPRIADDGRAAIDDLE